MSKETKLKKIIALITALFMVLSMSMVPANAQPLDSLVCTGAVSGTYVDDGAKPNKFDYKSVTVPEGASCVLNNVSVKGNVKSLHGSVDVKVLDSYVGGVVHVKDATGLVHVGQAGCKFDPTVRVNVLVYDSHSVLICYVNAHNVQVKRNDGRITVRDSVSHRLDVSGNRAYVSDGNDTGHRLPGSIRVLRNDATQHIHLFHNDSSRKLVLRDNTPTPIVK